MRLLQRGRKAPRYHRMGKNHPKMNLHERTEYQSTLPEEEPMPLQMHIASQNSGMSGKTRSNLQAELKAYKMSW